MVSKTIKCPPRYQNDGKKSPPMSPIPLKTCIKHKCSFGFIHLPDLKTSSKQQTKPLPLPLPWDPKSDYFCVRRRGAVDEKDAKGTQSLQYATPQPPNNENSLPKRSPRRQNALQDTKMTAKGLHHCCRDPIKPEGTSPNRKAPNPRGESYIAMAL